MNLAVFRVVFKADENPAEVNAFYKRDRAREVFNTSASVVVQRIQRRNEHERYFYIAKKLTE